jgi:hypothetical protein
VAYKDGIYVFGGEVGFSAGTETPLWVYHIKVGHYCTWPGCGLVQPLLHNVYLLLLSAQRPTSTSTRFLDDTQRRPTVGRFLWTSDQLDAQTST